MLGWSAWSHPFVRHPEGGGGGGGGRGDATGGAEAGEGSLALEVEVDGERRRLADEDWLALEILAVRGDEKQHARDALSLRALAEHVAGAGAAVTQVLGAGGAACAIPDGAWRDGSRVPVLRLNRRGRFKFHWVDRALVPLEGDEVRFVERLVIRSAPRAG
jgi:hypothetical protein